MQKSKWDKELESRKLKGLLNSWYGPARAADEMTLHHEQFDLIGDVADRILKNLHARNCYAIMHIGADWEKIAGKQLGAVSRFVTLNGKCAEVEISHPIYLREMALPLKEILLKRIQDIVGPEKCEDIRFLASGRESGESSPRRTKSKWSKK